MISAEILKSTSFFKDFEADTVIATEGKKMGGKMYIVVEGTAGVYKNYGKPEQQMASELHPGDFFGELTLFLDKSYTATIVSHGELKLMEISRNNIYHFYQENPEATYLMMQTLCRRNESLNKSYAHLYEQIQSGAFKDKGGRGKSAGKTEKISTSTLFPRAHKFYALPDSELDEALLLDETLTCPSCGNKFVFPLVRTVILRTLDTDYDLRKTHKGINTTHFLVATCPKCLFSAIAEIFKNASKIQESRVNEIVGAYRNELGLTFEDMDANTIFARLYLALKFTYLCYDNSEILDARLWLNICWLYHDCGDDEMELYALGEALRAYRTAYENLQLNKKTEQSICLIIGELNYRLGNIEEAKRFLFTAKTCRGGNSTVEILADDRLTEIKKLEE